MSLSLWNAVVTIRDGVGRIGSQEVSASTVADQLEAGAVPAEIARNLGLTPRDFIAALAFDALGDEQDPVGPPLVQSPPRRPVLDVALSDAALAGLFPDAGRPARLRAGRRPLPDFRPLGGQPQRRPAPRGSR